MPYKDITEEEYIEYLEEKIDTYINFWLWEINY